MLFFKNNLTNLYIKTPFQLTCAVIQVKTDSVNTFAISITNINTECDFKREYLFRMCSVETNLVTSVVYKKAYYTSRAGRILIRHQPLPQSHKNTNHWVYNYSITNK